MKTLNIKQSITNRESNSLKHYFNDIKNIKLLNHDEEYELSYASFKGDNVAREKLVKHNLRFVVSVAKQYETNEIKLEDLINEGNIGLVMASTKFDPSRGFKFLSYAVYWIKRCMLAYISENGKTIRLPNNKIDIISKLKNRYELLEQKLEHPPNYNEMVSELSGDFSESDILFYLNNRNKNIKSLDKKIKDENNVIANLSDLIEGEDSIGPTHYVDKDDVSLMNEAILNMLGKDVERKIIVLIYGLDGKEPLSLKTIGFLLGLSAERVRQLRDKSLETLRIKLS